MTATNHPTPATAPFRGLSGMLREFAALTRLALPGFSPATVAAIRQAITDSSWRDVLPDRYAEQAVQRALCGLERRRQAAHTAERPARWYATTLGVEFVNTHVIGNPHVDPDAPANEAPTATSTAPPELLYFIDASVSEVLADEGTIAPNQPHCVRFGPFEDYVELTYGKLRVGPDGTTIGDFDAAREAWEVDGWSFSDLAIGAMPTAAARAGTGVSDHGQPTTMRVPRLRY